MDICNFAEDKTLFICKNSFENFVKPLEENVEFALDWFKKNRMKLNTDICHL